MIIFPETSCHSRNYLPPLYLPGLYLHLSSPIGSLWYLFIIQGPLENTAEEPSSWKSVIRKTSMKPPKFDVLLRTELGEDVN